MSVSSRSAYQLDPNVTFSDSHGNRSLSNNPMNPARQLSDLLDSSSLKQNTNITILRDSTESGDAIPLLQHLTRTLSSVFQFSKHRIIYLSTRSRSCYEGSTKHIYPIQSRQQGTALSTCSPIDAYSVTAGKRGSDATRQLLTSLERATEDGGLVMIECLHSLRFIFDINPAVFVRSVSSMNAGVSVIVAAPTGCGVDGEIASLVQICDTTLDLTDLQTGFAIDVDGMIRIARHRGRWLMNSVARRYKITDAAFNIYT